MGLFKDNYLLERNQAEEATYKSLRDVIEPHKNDPYIYVHLTKALPSDTLKRGGEALLSTKPLSFNVNRPSSYDNAFGVYAYPVSFVIKALDSNTFKQFYRADASHYFVLKANPSLPHIDDIGAITERKLQECYKKILHHVKNPEVKKVYEQAEETQHDNGSPGAILNWFIVLLSKDPELQEYFKGSTPSVKQNYIYNKILGYAWMNDDGHGIIHRNEMYQAGFFTPKAFQVIHEGYNKDYKLYKDVMGKKEFTAQSIHNILDAFTYRDSNATIKYKINERTKNLSFTSPTFKEVHFRAIAALMHFATGWTYDTTGSVTFEDIPATDLGSNSPFFRLLGQIKDMKILIIKSCDLPSLSWMKFEEDLNRIEFSSCRFPDDLTSMPDDVDCSVTLEGIQNLQSTKGCKINGNLTISNCDDLMTLEDINANYLQVYSNKNLKYYKNCSPRTVKRFMDMGIKLKELI